MIRAHVKLRRRRAGTELIWQLKYGVKWHNIALYQMYIFVFRGCVDDVT